MPYGRFPTLDTDHRFFARLGSFDCECPHCGQLILVGQKKRDTECYNKITSVVTCPARGCGRKFLVGIVAWPVAPGRGSGKGRPTDQRPSLRQLREIRAAAKGVWAEVKRKRAGSPVNTIQPEVVIEGEIADEQVEAILSGSSRVEVEIEGQDE